MAVYPTRLSPPEHFTLLLYGGHAPFTIKAHRSRVAVRPDLRTVAVTRLLPARVGWLAPYGPDFLGRHPDARLCGRGGWLLFARENRPWFLYVRNNRERFLCVRNICGDVSRRLKLARKILIESLSILANALEDFCGGQRREKEHRKKNAYGFQHSDVPRLVFRFLVTRSVKNRAQKILGIR